jgi:hypothetical protein
MTRVKRIEVYNGNGVNLIDAQEIEWTRDDYIKELNRIDANIPVYWIINAARGDEWSKDKLDKIEHEKEILRQEMRNI